MFLSVICDTQKKPLEILFALMVLYGKRDLVKNLVNTHVVAVCNIVDTLGHLKKVAINDLYFLAFNTYCGHW